MQPVQKIYAVWVYVSDITESRNFYERILGVKPILENEGWIEFDTGETVFAILERPKEKPSYKPSKTRIMFQIADLAGKEKELSSQSVKIVHRMNESYGTILTFEDPDGNWLEFYEPHIS